MQVSQKSVLLKVFLGLVMFTLFSLGKVEDAHAQSISDTELQIVESEAAPDVDWNSIMVALEGQEITDGSSFVIDGIRLDCEVTIEPIVDSKTSAFAPSSDQLVSAASTTTSTYSAVLNVYAYVQSTNTRVAVITHSASITYYDTGKVHINSGSISVGALHSYYSGYAYGYTINNTNGSYSSAYGMVELYNSYDKLYSYYGSNVSVTPGSSPSFSFNQV